MEKREFGTNLKKLREQAGLNQRELAQRVGVDFSYLSKIENGVMSPPSQEVILRLAEALHADKDELLTLAGRVPFDIAQMLKNLEVMQSLRKGDVARKSESGSKRDSFGKRLKGLRETAGLSQGELADKVGVSFTYLSKIENGVKPPPSEKVILKLAETLNCDKDDLMASAGKVPSDIARILKNREVRQSLRENQARRTMMSASGNRKGTSMMKHLMNGRSFARVALAFVLVLAVAASLWFSSPSAVKALMIEITKPGGGALVSGTIGQNYAFEVKVTVDDGELLPIEGIGLSIFNSTNASYAAHLMNLPLINGGSANYTNVDTGGGTANVTAVINNLSFGYGAGYAVWGGYTYNFPTGYGYRALSGPATITYSIIWTPPSGWPEGNYNIHTMIAANDDTFTKISSVFTLQGGLMAETGISQSANTTGIGDTIVVKVNINRIKNPTDNVTATIPGGIGSYSATVSGNPGNAIQFLTVYGVAPFIPPTFNNTTGVFSATAITLPPQAGTVAKVVPILTGNNATSVILTVTFQDIRSADQPGLNVPEEYSNNITFKRGDAFVGGGITIADSLAIKQYLVSQLTLSQINPLNAASVNHDGTGGDKITIGDALAIEQYLVGQRNGDYQ